MKDHIEYVLSNLVGFELMRMDVRTWEKDREVLNDDDAPLSHGYSNPDIMGRKTTPPILATCQETFHLSYSGSD